MRRFEHSQIFRISIAAAVMAALLGLAGISSAEHSHTSKPFSGAKVNGGTVTHSKQGGKNVLTVSNDFKVPDTPDPHWQVVDSKGKVYPLHRLGIKGDKVNLSITLPDYVPDVAKVQIWCAWAETLLGEAPFDAPVK
jgi:hypothetical protein